MSLVYTCLYLGNITCHPGTATANVSMLPGYGDCPGYESIYVSFLHMPLQLLASTLTIYRHPLDQQLRSQLRRLGSLGRLVHPLRQSLCFLHPPEPLLLVQAPLVQLHHRAPQLVVPRDL